jgi:molybdopterin synthase catalytic subunit
MIRIQVEPFDESEAFTLRRGRADVGGLVSFTGYVRDFTQSADVTSLELQHYPGFTETEISKIVEKARGRFEILDCLVIHRYGRMLPGDPIVLVSVIAVHRDAAFEAARLIMDYLKTDAPFWKKEIGASGERWIEPRADDHAARAEWAEQEKTKP